MNLFSPLIEALGWTLLHFLWEGTVIGAVLWVALRTAMRRARPHARYVATGAALAFMVATVATTLWRQGNDSFSAAARRSAEVLGRGSPSGRLSAGTSLARPGVEAFAGSPVPGSAAASPTPRPGASHLPLGGSVSTFPRFFPWLVGLWTAGSGLLSLRILNSWRLTRWLRLSAGPPEDAAWHTRFTRMRERLRVSQSVRLLSSASAAVPMVIGWLKPVVLVPAALFAGMPPSHLEAILAHELAHVRRHDYLVNLLQTLVETLFFYHPAVWWVSAQLRAEREHCCDDAASSMCDSPTDYARALAALEALRDSAPVLGMAATGGSLLRRVRRLLGATDEHVPGAAWPVGLCALAVLVAAVPLTLLSVASEPPTSTPQAQAADGATPGEAPQFSPEYERVSAALRSAEAQPYAFTQARLNHVLGFLAEKAGIKCVALAGSTRDTDTLITFNTVASPFVALETVSRAYDVALTLDNDIWRMRLMHDKASRKQEALLSSPEYERASAPLRSAKQQQYNFTRARLKDVLRDLAYDAGINFMALAGSASAPDTLITFNTVASPFVALESVSRAYDVALTLDNDIWHIRPMDERPSRRQEVLRYSPEYESVGATLRSAEHQQYNFTRAGLNDVLRFLAEDAGINYLGLPESEGDTDRRITFNIMASPFVALETVSQAYGVALSLDHDVWQMRRLEDSQQSGRDPSTPANSIRPLPVIEFRLVAEAAGPDTEALSVPEHWNDARKKLEVLKSAILGACDVVSATPERSATTGDWGISLRLTDKGARKLSKSSKENIGKQLAMVMNGRIISAPMVRSEIGSPVVVSGTLSQVEASDLAGAIQKAAATADPAVESTLRVITLGKDNALRLEGAPATLQELEQRLRKDARSHPGLVVTLRCDDRAEYQRVKDVLDIVTKLGIPHVGLATKPDGQKPPGAEPAQPDERPAKPSPPPPVLQFRLVADAAGPDTERVPVPKPGKDRPSVLDLEKAAVVRADDVALVTAKHNEQTGFWDLDLRFTDQGGENLARASKANVGRQLAIVVNGEVISAPTIRSEIGRDVMISGRFSEAEAKELVGTIETAMKAKPRAIVIQQDGTILFENAPMTLEELGQRLRRGFASNPEIAVILRSDERTQYQRVVDVLETVGKAGITQVGLVTQPDDQHSAADKNGIHISVLEASGKPIPVFRVVAGVKPEVSPGREVVNWQPHTVRVGQDGLLIWPLAKAYDLMALRIEADGYAPQVVAGIRKSEGAKEVSVQLVRDAGTAGRALTPKGQPAAGATVALAMVQRDAVIENGTLRHLGDAVPEKPGDRWRWPVFVMADAEGRFQLPAENEATAAVLIVHESGVREMALVDFKKSPEVKLQLWGRLEGRVLWGDKVGADQPVSVTVHRDDYGYPGVIAQYESTRSAADGSFVVERVLPGLVQVSCPIVPEPNKSGMTEINVPGRTTHVTVQPGATPVLIGGQGRTVRGRLTGRDSWESVTFHFHPTAPHVGFPGDDEMWKAWGEFQHSTIGPRFFRNGLKVAADGTFEIPEVLPGDYQIFFSREGEKSHVATGKFEVATETPGTKPEAQDIGEFKATGGAK